MKTREEIDAKLAEKRAEIQKMREDLKGMPINHPHAIVSATFLAMHVGFVSCLEWLLNEEPKQ